MHVTLSPDEIRAVRQAFAEARARPEPVRRGSTGCLVAIVAVAVFLGLPSFLGWLGITLPQLIGVSIGAVLLAAALGGAAVAVLGGGDASADARGAALSALDTLSRPAGELELEERRQAAVELLANAYLFSGPTATAAFDVVEARERLGDNGPYVLAVERVLLEEPGIQPVFTLAAETEEEG